MTTDRDEYRAAIARMTEWDRSITENEVQRSLGMIGDKEDARDE